MKGETLKNILRRYGVTQSEVAKIIGYTPQNLGSMLNANDVKSSTVEKVAGALGVSVGALYGEAGANNSAATASDHSAAVVGNGNNLNTNDSALLKLLDEKDKQIKQYQAQISELIAIISKRG